MTFVYCIARYLEVSIEEWLEDKERQLEDKGQLELVFRPFLRWLDRNIEDVVTEALKQVNALLRVTMLLMRKRATIVNKVQYKGEGGGGCKIIDCLQICSV